MSMGCLYIRRESAIGRWRTGKAGLKDVGVNPTFSPGSDLEKPLFSGSPPPPAPRLHREGWVRCSELPPTGSSRESQILRLKHQDFPWWVFFSPSVSHCFSFLLSRFYLLIRERESMCTSRESAGKTPNCEQTIGAFLTLPVPLNL